jgi:hypothetical protein
VMAPVTRTTAKNVAVIFCIFTLLYLSFILFRIRSFLL